MDAIAMMDAAAQVRGSAHALGGNTKPQRAK